MKRVTCFLTFCFLYHVVSSQNSYQDDTSRINQLILHARSVLFTTPDQAWDESILAINLAKKADYPLGLANGYRLAGVIQADIKADNISAMKYYHLADSIYSTNQDSKFREGKGAVLHSYGTVYQRQGDYLKAVQYYILAAQLLDSLKNKTILPKTLNNLSTLYAFLQQYEKSESYARQCLAMATEIKDSYLISIGNITLAGSLIDQGKYEDAFPFIQKAFDIAEKRNDHYIMGLSYFNFGNYYGYYKKDYKRSVSYLQKALEQSKLLGNQWEEARASTNLAEIYMISHDFENARKNAATAYSLASLFASLDLKQRAVEILSGVDAHDGNYREAYNKAVQSLNLRDSVFKEENQRNINYLESLYQTEKKEKEIFRLQKEKEISDLKIKRNKILNYALTITIILIISIVFFIYRSIRNKRIIAGKQLELERQKVAKLEKEHQLLATQSVLQGEEAERSRLARDLHDGLGGLLSGVKLALSGVKGNFIVPQSNVNQLDHALNLLDNSIQELRRVAHNMMPEALIKFGLREALQDFCDQLQNQKTKVLFQFFGEDIRADQSLEITIYRIAQELLNNSIKHAEAYNVMVQLIRDKDRISLTVQDNGKGFDMSILKESKGAGIANIRSRIEAMNGRFEFITEPGKGTEATVEFTV